MGYSALTSLVQELRQPALDPSRGFKAFHDGEGGVRERTLDSMGPLRQVAQTLMGPINPVNAPLPPAYSAAHHHGAQGFTGSGGHSAPPMAHAANPTYFAQPAEAMGHAGVRGLVPPSTPSVPSPRFPVPGSGSQSPGSQQTPVTRAARASSTSAMAT